MTASLPLPGAVHSTDKGLRIWQPHFTELQVCHLPAGEVVLSVLVTGQPAMTFSMTAQQRDHLVQLLSRAPGSEGGGDAA